MQSWSARPIPGLPGPPPLRPVQAFDTLRRRLVPIGPASGRARMYVCGITPYDATHIGHAATYVAFDLLNRVWRDRGLDVTYVQNVTDVDDPLLERAPAAGVDWQSLAEQQTQLYREDMTALNVLPPEHLVGAVESIPQVVELISELQERRERCTRSRTRTSPTCTSPRTATPSSARSARLSEAEALADVRREGRRPGARRARRRRWTAWSGDWLAPGSRPGTPPSGPGDRAGTSSARRSRWTCWAPTSTSKAGAATWSSRTTRCRPPRAGWPPTSRSPRRTCTAGWSAWTGRRCRSRGATWSSSRRCASPASTRWPSGSPCSPTTTATTGSGTTTCWPRPRSG